jgi:hypothetical protein
MINTSHESEQITERFYHILQQCISSQNNEDIKKSSFKYI